MIIYFSYNHFSALRVRVHVFGSNFDWLTKFVFAILSLRDVTTWC